MNSRFIEVTVCFNGGVKHLPTDAAARLHVIRADGVGSSFEGSISQSGRVIIPIDRWVTTVAGDSSCSLEISHQKQILSTMSFTVRTECSDDAADLSDSGITPTDPEYDAVLEMLDDYRNGRLGGASLSTRSTTISYTQSKGTVAIPEGTARITLSGKCSGYMSGGVVFFLLLDASYDILSSTVLARGDDSQIYDVSAVLTPPEGARYLVTCPFNDRYFDASTNYGYVCELTAVLDSDVALLSVTDRSGTKTVELKNVKSAYQYAVDGGFKGSESDFSARLARLVSGAQ